MSKYHLVASYYDIFEKNPNLRYKDEIEIEIPGIDLSTIQAIDNFTASHKPGEILDILVKQLGITGRNQLAVKYQKNKSSVPIYYRIIENNLEFVSCTKNNYVDGYWVGDKYVRSLLIPQNVLLVKEWNKLLDVIERRNLDEFEQLYPYENTNLAYLVRRYINASYDTNGALNELNLIKKEFSRYKTFRGWIVAKNKKINYKKSLVVVKKNNQPIKTVSKNSSEVRSIDEYADEYEKDFNNDLNNKDKGITYASYQTYQYNTAHLDEDKEEFLEEDEMDFGEDNFLNHDDSSYSKRKNR